MGSNRTGRAERSAGAAQPAVIRRLAWYWQAEAANVVLVPALMVWLSNGQLGLPAVLAIVPMCALLVAGTTYLRGKYRQLTARVPLDRAQAWLAAAQLPLLAGTLVALAVMAWAWFEPALIRGPAERWVITVAAILAALEYVNYYHRQLQHFDNASDLRRLLTGRGFRPSQLRRDLERAGLRKTRAPLR